MNREYDYLFKLVIIGNSGVGKSSLLLRFADDQFSETYLTTIGVDFRFKTLKIDDKNVKLQIWDTAGQERFRTITNAYYKGADGIVIVYDTTSQSSFDDIEKFWINEVESYAEKDVDLLLLGNKNDMDKRVVDAAKAKEYADKRKMQFFLTSAKTAEQVETAFVTVSRKLIKKREEQIAAKKASRKTKDDGFSAISPQTSEVNRNMKLDRKDEQTAGDKKKDNNCC